MTPELQGVYENEVEKMDRFLIAAESWSSQYKKDRDTHTKIIKTEAKFRRQIRGLFRDMAGKIEQNIDWNQYAQALSQVKADASLKAAVDVKVIVKDDFFEELDALFFTVAFETLSTAVATGFQAGESIYKFPLGIRSSDEIIQSLTTDRLAWLVGKKVDKSGNVVDNPNADYRISDKTRANIASNIKTGIALGEDKHTMTNRLQDVIQDPGRAERIAQTETVNAYGSGLLQFGRESDATGKEWEDAGAVDVCADNAGQGAIGIDETFISGDDAPAAHTGCRCNLRLLYANEFPG